MTPHEPAVPTDNIFKGLTKREWFAGMAMNGILSQVRIEDRVEKTVSEWAYAIADAMLKESEK